MCDDLVFNRRPDALQRLIEHFESVIPSEVEGSSLNEELELPIAQQIHNAILRRRKDGIEAKIDRAAR